MIEVPPEVTPGSPSFRLNTPFTPRHAHQGLHTCTPRPPQRHLPKDFHKVLQQGIGLEHIRPFLGAIMQLKPVNTGILLGDNGDAD